MNKAMITNKMRTIGGPRACVSDEKIWTKSNRVKERIYKELRKTKNVIHSGG